MKNHEVKIKQPITPEDHKETAEMPRVEVFFDQFRGVGDRNTAEHIKSVQRKIDDEKKIEQIRDQFGMEDRDIKIQSFIHELPSKGGYIDFSQLQKVGQGGTHDVYVYPQNPTFVVKLNRSAFKKALGLSQIEFKTIADQYAGEENGKKEELYEYFGREHCLSEKVLVQKISVEQDGVSQNIDGIILIQEASDIFRDQNKKDFSVGYMEDQKRSVEQNKETYDRLNRELLGHDEFDEKNYLKFEDKLQPIFELIDKDKAFADCMREFLLRFKNYFEASGKFIDLVGQDNVLFYQQDHQWTFQLGSVVKGENKQAMKEVLAALENNIQVLNQEEGLRIQLKNILALVRLLNATGLKVGMGKIIDIQLSEKQLENLDRIKF